VLAALVCPYFRQGASQLGLGPGPNQKAHHPTFRAPLNKKNLLSDNAPSVMIPLDSGLFLLSILSIIATPTLEAPQTITS